MLKICLNSTSSLFASIFLAAAAVPACAAAQPAPSETVAQIAQNYGKLPLSFEANQGQTDPRVKFLSQGNGYSLFLTDSAAVLSLSRSRFQRTCAADRGEGPASTAKAALDTPSCPGESGTIQMRLAHANPAAQATGLDRLPGAANYFLGSGPANWRTNVPTYAKVLYRSVYDGIDLVYYGNQTRLEYDFIVAPGHNPGQIQLRFEKASKTTLAADGSLIVAGQGGIVRFHQPVVYQERDGRRRTIAGRFRLDASRTVRFSLGAYDRTRPLVIDPILIYATYLGGSGSKQGGGDVANGIAVDSYGNAYVTGSTGSSNFPASDGIQSSKKGLNTAFVTKLNPSGTVVVYSTYLGGSGTDSGQGVAVDATSEAYVTGWTTSTDFPTTAGAFQTHNLGGSQAFVAKLNTAGSALVYSTYLGGRASEAAVAIAVSAGGEAAIAGTATSDDLPTTPGVFQPKMAGSRTTGFVAQFNATGAKANFLTYLGGSGGDNPSALALDAAANVYVAGATSSTDFPLPAGATAYQTANKSQLGLSNGFVAKLNPSATKLLYGTYLGGSGSSSNDNMGDANAVGDAVYALAVDSDGDAWVAGAAGSTDFPVTDGSSNPNHTVDFYYCQQSQIPFDPTCSYGGGASGYVTNASFLAQLSPNGGALLYSTYIGGAGACYNTYAAGADIGYGLYYWNNYLCAGDTLTALALNSDGSLYLTGAFYSDTSGTVSGNGISYAPILHHLADGATIGLTNLGGSGLTADTNDDSTFCPPDIYYYYCTADTYGYYGSGANALAIPPPNAKAYATGNFYVAGFTHSADFQAGNGAYQPATRSQLNGNAFIAALNPAASIASTAIALKPSATSVPLGNSLSVLATVASPAGIPAGSVKFLVDGEETASAGLTALGTATYTASSLPLGEHKLTATYSGSSSYEQSTSPTVAVDVIPKPTAATPVLSPAPGTFTSAQKISVTDVTKGAILYYSTNGSTPTTKYTGPISVDATATIKAMAIAAGYSNSPVVSGQYAIHLPLDLPKLSLASGTYATAQTVSITDASPVAKLFYTTNGQTPTASSTLYTKPIAVSKTETLKVVALATGYPPSAVVTERYTIK